MEQVKDQNKIALLLEAMRFRTLRLALGPILIAHAISFKNCSYAHPFDPAVAIITAFCFFLLQIGANLTNDYCDGMRGTDHAGRIGFRRMTQSGLLTPHFVRKSFITCFALAILLGFILINRGGFPIAMIGFFSVTAAYMYTGGPIPLSYIGLGEILAFLFFGPLAFIGINFLQNYSYSSQSIFWSIPVGLLTAVPMSINNLRDRVSDQLVGKKTLSVVFGEKFARRLPIILTIISALFPLYAFLFFSHNFFYLLSLTGLVFLKKSIKSLLFSPVDSSFNFIFIDFGKYLLSYCISNSLAIMTS